MPTFKPPQQSRPPCLPNLNTAGFGATAVDGVDGAITAISFSGLQAVNTSQVRLHVRSLFARLYCVCLWPQACGSQCLNRAAAACHAISAGPCLDSTSCDHQAGRLLRRRAATASPTQRSAACTACTVNSCCFAGAAPQAGRYSLTYSAADRAGNVASASQTIVVRSPCTAPERLCLSSCSCSSFG